MAVNFALEIADWLRLVHTTGLGRANVRKLLAAFGLPANIFCAGHRNLLEVVSPRHVKLIEEAAAAEDKTQALLEKTCLWLEDSNNRLLTLADANYPPLLLEIPDPPLLLYVKGNLDLLHRQSLAIVGSRNASQQGMLDAEKFAESLSHTGLTIVSGLAGGIDTAAHRGGLRGAASTIAVIGTGADIVYPAKNRELAHQIAAQGCIVSEYPLGMPAIAHNFPSRNRIISGLSRGVLVIEAALQSGSLITARTALEQGRDVFAIPGSIHSALAKGCHQLIKQGAKLVETAQDVLEEMQLPATSTISSQAALPLSIEPEMSDAEQSLLSTIGFTPIAPDILANQIHIDAAQLVAELLNLELAGLVERLPDGRYQRLQN